MQHPKYGHITYQVRVYSYAINGTHLPATFTKEFEHWQSAYAWVRDHIRTDAAATKCIEVVKHRYDGFIHQGIFHWNPVTGRTV